MSSLTGWICHVAGEPNMLVYVNWHCGINCGVSVKEPRELSGTHKVIKETALEPVEMQSAVRGSVTLSLTSISTEQLKDKLETLRTLRAEEASKPTARRKTASKEPVTKRGLLGLISRMPPEGIDALEKAVANGLPQEEILKIIRSHISE